MAWSPRGLCSQPVWVLCCVELCAEALGALRGPGAHGTVDVCHRGRAVSALSGSAVPGLTARACPRECSLVCLRRLLVVEAGCRGRADGWC